MNSVIRRIKMGMIKPGDGVEGDDSNFSLTIENVYIGVKNVVVHKRHDLGCIREPGRNTQALSCFFFSRAPIQR